MRSFLNRVRPVVVALLLTVSVVTPFSADAAALSVHERQKVIAQIEQLLKQIAALQVQLSALRSTALVSDDVTVYRSRFFDVPLEAIYRVRDNRLYRLDVRGGAVRSVDQQLFTFFQSVIGQEAVTRYVDEFRVFSGDIEELSAFVETKGRDNEWIVGVNRAEFDITDQLNRESFAELFVHEYAHLLFLEDKDFVEEYRGLFWSGADERHSNAVADTDNRWVVLEQYFKANSARFVSDYATLNVDEDMAETFQVFVTQPKPQGSSVRDQKVLYFYNSPAMMDVRAMVRSNLARLGVL